MDTTLASAADAQLVLKLYELRTEETMRKARAWLAIEFWPQSADDVFAILKDFGSEENCYLRQVTSYWEMASAFVLHGALDGDLYIDCNGEPTFVLAKFHPFLSTIRGRHPNFLANTEQVTLKYPAAKQRFDVQLRGMESRRAQAAGHAV